MDPDKSRERRCTGRRQLAQRTIAGALVAILIPAAPLPGADPARHGLLLSWEAREVAQRPDLTLEGAARYAAAPSRIECAGGGAVLSAKALRPERVSVEAAFRVDRRSGPLQLIVTTHPPDRRVPHDGPGNPRQWVLQIAGDSGPAPGHAGHLEFGIFGEDQAWHIVRTPTRIPRGWHHAVGTFDGTQVRLFVNGRPQDPPASYKGRINQPPDTLVNLPAAGANSPGSGDAFQGAIALLRLYDRALSPAEITCSHRSAQALVPMLSEAVPAARRLVKPPFKVLYSNDFTNTGVVSPYHARGTPFHPDHLRASVREATGADAHLLQPAHGAVPWWPSKLYPIAEHHAWWSRHYGIAPERVSALNSVHRYLLGGGDPFREFISACRDAGQSAFISMRLNDTHHLAWADTPGNRQGIHSISRFYVEHPEYRLGRTGTGLDWAIPEVRARMSGFIKEITSNWDIDGLELDFMRFPAFFKPDTPHAVRGEIMTRFVADTRAALDAGARPGRGHWLCARIPCKLAMLPEIGIDLLELVDAGVDMLNLSASYFTFQNHDLAAVRALLPDAALYLEMCHCTMLGRAVSTAGGDRNLFLRTTDHQYYTTAHMAYRRGADGVSLFNFVYTREHGAPERGPWNEPPFHVLARLKDPAWLARQPQWYVLSHNSFAPMQIRFVQGDAHTFMLDMSPNEHQRKDGVLRLMSVEDGRARRWMVKVNGMTIEPRDYVAKPIDHPYDATIAAPEQYACFACPRHTVREGVNRIAVILERGAPATIQSIDVALP